MPRRRSPGTRPSSPSGSAGLPASRSALRAASVLGTGTVLLCTGLTGASAATAVPPTPSGLPAAIESLQPYVGQSTCDPVAKPGVRAFSTLLLNTYKDTSSLGIVRDCGIGGQSEHKEGRAFDWGVSVNNAQQLAEAHALLDWLLAPDANGNQAARARRLGIMYMIFNHQIWKAYQPERGWQAYSGSNPHTDHVHFSFGWNGAKAVTSWFDGTVAPVDYGPAGAGSGGGGTTTTPPPTVTPVARKENLTVLARWGSTTLSVGSTEHEAVAVVQKALGVTADGDFGPQTKAAVQWFQDNQDLATTGTWSAPEWKAMFPKPTAPFGNNDSLGFRMGKVVVEGWAMDADSVDPVKVVVTVDGEQVTTLTASQPRADVAAVYPGNGDDLGFSGALDLPDGAHEVCTTVLNAGAGTVDSPLGCSTVPVRHSPTGRADEFGVHPGALVSRGWAFDPDTTATVSVEHTVDGTPLDTVAADEDRPDVGAAYPAYGPERGFETRLDLRGLPAGSHELCATATNQGAGSDTELACETAVVRHDAFGVFDELSAGPEGLRVRGWAIEPDVEGPATVVMTVDGRPVPSVRADQERDDLVKPFPVDGALHGFNTVLPAPARGKHGVCLVVVNQGPGKAAPLGCKTVTVP